MNRPLLEQPFTAQQIKQREGRFGDVLDYVEGAVVIQRLNDALEGAWSFEILEHQFLDDEVMVIGRLSAAGVSKTQFGRSQITRHRESKKPLSLGDDCKAAATDCLKKCATLFGIGLHLYLEGTTDTPLPALSSHQSVSSPVPPATPPLTTNGHHASTPPPSGSGQHAAPLSANGIPERLTARQLAAIFGLGRSLSKSNKEIKALTLEIFGKVPDYLTRQEASTIISMLQEEEAHAETRVE